MVLRTILEPLISIHLLVPSVQSGGDSTFISCTSDVAAVGVVGVPSKRLSTRMTDPHHTPEMDTTLQINCTSIKEKKKVQTKTSGQVQHNDDYLEGMN